MAKLSGNRYTKYSVHCLIVSSAQSGATLRYDGRMPLDLSPHLDIATRHAVRGQALTAIPRLDIFMGQTVAREVPCLYRAVACFILQGSKRVTLDQHVLRYDSSHYLISALELPLVGQIFDEGSEFPYVAVSLVLDAGLLAELALAMPPVRDPDTLDIGIQTHPMSTEISAALLRLLTLLDTPGDIPVLAATTERELLYRLLQGPQGKLLRKIAQPEGPVVCIQRAVAWIRENYDKALRIDELCARTGMSRPSLHRHFRTMTGLSPLRYQKYVRLQEARRMLLDGGQTVSTVAFAVGYESASQFNREYVRQFTVPPARDREQRRQGIA
jgi:AraC-like DNA-binding protein